MYIPNICVKTSMLLAVKPISITIYIEYITDYFKSDCRCDLNMYLGFDRDSGIFSVEGKRMLSYSNETLQSHQLAGITELAQLKQVKEGHRIFD